MCKTLIIVIEDRNYEWRKAEEGKQESGWIRTRKFQRENDDDMVIPRVGEFGEVVCNTEFARSLEAKFADLKRTIVEQSIIGLLDGFGYMREKAAAVEMKVLSE